MYAVKMCTMKEVQVFSLKPCLYTMFPAIEQTKIKYWSQESTSLTLSPRREITVFKELRPVTKNVCSQWLRWTSYTPPVVGHIERKQEEDWLLAVAAILLADSVLSCVRCDEGEVLLGFDVHFWGILNTVTTCSCATKTHLLLSAINGPKLHGLAMGAP